MAWLWRAAAGAAALAVAAQFKLTIPGSPVPVTGQTLVLALLAGFVGPRIAFRAVGLYVAAAAAGLPVLSGGRGGWAVVSGPSVGYLVGFFAAALVIPLALRRLGTRSWPRVWLAVECGSACVLGAGAFGLMLRGLPALDAVTRGVVPYLLGDLVKSTLAATILWAWRRGR